MKWNKLIKDLNYYMIHTPDINLKTAKAIIEIFYNNFRQLYKEKYKSQFLILKYIDNKQLTLKTTLKRINHENNTD